MATQQQNSAQKQAQQNHEFMRYSFLKPAPLISQNDNSFKSGKALKFITPVIQGGYADFIRVFCDLTINYTAAGASPTVANNAAAPYNLIDNVTVMYGNEQITVNPYVLTVLQRLSGFSAPSQGTVVGLNNSEVQSLLQSTSFPTAAGNNTWRFYFDIPLRLKPHIYGMLPIDGNGTQVQVNLHCNSDPVGVDPLDATINTNGTVTVSGTVSPVVFYRDFLSMSFSNKSIAPDLTGLPTAQIIQPVEINPLTASNYRFKKFDNPYPFVKLVSIIIDGNQSGEFCAVSNITGYELDQAENQNSAFVRYDDTSQGNSPLDTYYSQVRDQLRQDLDSGVLYFDSQLINTPDSNLLSGDAVLNLAPGKAGAIRGYPAARMGVKVATVGDAAATGITPRVVTWATIINNQGITPAS